MTTAPRTIIALLNYNGRAFLEKHLPSVERNAEAGIAIVLIDNASTDDSLSYVEQHFPSVHIIRLAANLGYAGGYNEGLQGLEADYFVLLNTDVELPGGCIRQLVDKMEADSSIGIAQPKVLSLQRPGYFEYAGGAGGYIDKYGYTFTRGRLFDSIEKDEGQYDDDTQVFWASGACLIIRASLFHELGGFFPYFFMYSEEVDLCWRAAMEGHKVYVFPSAVVYHRETTSFAAQSADRIYFVFRNNLVMLMKNLPLASRIPIIPARIFLNIAAAFFFLVKGHGRKSLLVLKSIFAACWWAIAAKKPHLPHRKKISQLKGVFRGSLLTAYHFGKKASFSRLDKTLLQ